MTPSSLGPAPGVGNRLDPQCVSAWRPAVLGLWERVGAREERVQTQVLYSVLCLIGSLRFREANRSEDSCL